MKKILLILSLILIANIANADVMPYYINSLKRYGIGYTMIQSPLVMRQEPSKDGKILETLSFNFKNNQSYCQINKTRCETDEIYSAYSESKKIAMLTTLDETEGWNLVCFNQKENPICGWVDSSKNKYYTWTEFFGTLGKKYGLYVFKDVSKSDRILYSAPLKQTNSVGSIEMASYITPWLIRGNWILVKVNDFNKQFKTGYINFRGNDGKLRLFVKF